MILNRLFTLLCVSILAFSSNSAAADTGFYVSGALGQMNADIGLGVLNRVDDDQSAYSLGVGYWLTENLSLEASYLDATGFAATTNCPPGFACITVPLFAQADVSGISVSILGDIPLAERLHVFGRIGVTAWDVDFEGISAAFNASGEDLLYGAGLRLSMGEHWNLLAEYQRIELDTDTASVGVRYRF